ncbi:MAG: redoxin domain-containing protein [Chloroflexi bacterium]|nr:MAG: redoxin domain-containing protein [Chloroflexota bacterium]
MCKRLRLFNGVLVVLAWSVAIAAGQVGTTFGPKDGTGLPPTDLTRVAVGAPAPDFTLESKDGAAVTLSSFRDRKDVVVVFYRGHW